MKNLSRLIKLSHVLLILIAMGCGSAATSDIADEGTDTTTGSTITSETAIYDATLQVAPSFSRASSASVSLRSTSKEVSSAWESGNPLYDIFYILQEFNPDTDQGVIDTSNLYKTMWESRNFVANAKASCEAITAQAILPPFDFGNDPVEYDCAHNDIGTESGYDNGVAIMELDADGNPIEIAEGASADESIGEGEGDGEDETAPSDDPAAAPSAVVQRGVMGFIWVDPSHYEYGSLQAELDASTDDLSLDIAIWVDYDGESDYCYRNDIDGNAQTHAFTIRSAKGNLSAISMSAVGKGTSQGEGNHFLIKMVEGPVADRYFCIGAEDGEDELRAMDPEGSETVPEECQALQDEVDAMVPLVLGDLLCESTDLNPGGTGVAAEGTIFLDFE